MNKYTGLSDFEINKKVASHYLPCDYNLNEYTKTVELIGFLGDTDEYIVYGTFDPCSNPSDAMPIIIENKICTAFDVFAEERDGGNWVASPAYDFDNERTRSNNLYRAAMELFLLMKEAESEG